MHQFFPQFSSLIHKFTTFPGLEPCMAWRWHQGRLSPQLTLRAILSRVKTASFCLTLYNDWLSNTFISCVCSMHFLFKTMCLKLVTVGRAQLLVLVKINLIKLIFSIPNTKIYLQYITGFVIADRSASQKRRLISNIIYYHSDTR